MDKHYLFLELQGKTTHTREGREYAFLCGQEIEVLRDEDGHPYSLEDPQNIIDEQVRRFDANTNDTADCSAEEWPLLSSEVTAALEDGIDVFADDGDIGADELEFQLLHGHSDEPRSLRIAREMAGIR